MKFTEENGAGRYRVRGYDETEITVEWGSIDVDGQAQLESKVFISSFILTPDGLVGENLPTSIDALETAHLQQLVALDIEVLLLGTGSELTFPAGELIGWLSQQGVGLEVMNNPAACRTYNLLMLEDRRVAALFLVG